MCSLRLNRARIRSRRATSGDLRILREQARLTWSRSRFILTSFILLRSFWSNGSSRKSGESAPFPQNNPPGGQFALVVQFQCQSWPGTAYRPDRGAATFPGGLLPLPGPVIMGVTWSLIQQTKNREPLKAMPRSSRRVEWPPSVHARPDCDPETGPIDDRTWWTDYRPDSWALPGGDRPPPRGWPSCSMAVVHAGAEAERHRPLLRKSTVRGPRGDISRPRQIPTGHIPTWRTIRGDFGRSRGSGMPRRSWTAQSAGRRFADRHPAADGGDRGVAPVGGLGRSKVRCRPDVDRDAKAEARSGRRSASETWGRSSRSSRRDMR